jgi:hypothetical protein
MEDRRHYPRFNSALQVMELSTLKTGLTTNISLGGCFIEKTKDLSGLPLDSRVTLKFEIPGINDLVVIFGEVSHHGQKDEGFGIKFKEVDKKSAYYLGRYMGTFF